MSVHKPTESVDAFCTFVTDGNFFPWFLHYLNILQVESCLFTYTGVECMKN